MKKEVEAVRQEFSICDITNADVPAVLELTRFYVSFFKFKNPGNQEVCCRPDMHILLRNHVPLSYQVKGTDSLKIDKRYVADQKCSTFYGSALNLPVFPNEMLSVKLCISAS